MWRGGGCGGGAGAHGRLARRCKGLQGGEREWELETGGALPLDTGGGVAGAGHCGQRELGMNRQGAGSRGDNSGQDAVEEAATGSGCCRCKHVRRTPDMTECLCSHCVALPDTPGVASEKSRAKLGRPCKQKQNGALVMQQQSKISITRVQRVGYHICVCRFQFTKSDEHTSCVQVEPGSIGGRPRATSPSTASAEL